MTVKELIEKLKALPEDAEVEIAYNRQSDYYHGPHNINDVEESLNSVEKKPYDNTVMLYTQSAFKK